MTAGCPAVQSSHAMCTESSAAYIAAKVREILERGMDLSPETLRFIDGTFSDPSAAEVEATLEDDASVERDSLLELLFSPDEALQIELENLLAIQHRANPDAEEVAARLAMAPLAVIFRFPGGRGELKVALTPRLARRLTSELRITRNLPAPAAEVIDVNFTGRARQRLRVMIRNARFDFTAANTEFLCALIPRLDVHGDDGRKCFAFALELLAEIGESEDIYAKLVARKKWLARALHHNQRQREHLAQANVETLLSRGERLTWVDEAETRSQIGFIDRICLAVFGAIPQVDSGPPAQEVEMDGVPDIADLMRRLT
jgi:hypothetical protein